MLDYEIPKRHYHPTAEDRSWLVRRLIYYAAHVLFLLAIVYRVGPNLFLFHSPLSPAPADYITFARDYVPMIAALKAYQRDSGALPHSSDELPKEYRPINFQGEEGQIMGSPTITFPIKGHSVLVYDFAPATEGWSIYAPRYYGRIPAGIVQAAPSPATNPATRPKTDADQ